MNHPSPLELQKFSTGQLADERIEHIADHLTQCAMCVTYLDKLDNTDPLLQALQRCGPLPEALGRQRCSKQIGGYTLLEELGRGGMGIVYCAYDEQLKRDVALKVIPTGAYADSEQRQRLRQEAETMAALQHPGIVQVYAIGEQDAIMYIALELLHPGGLAVLKTEGKPRCCAALIQQVAETLHYAHQAGFVHRDIKPDNILLAPSGEGRNPWAALVCLDVQAMPQLKITDFGLSKSLDEDNQLTRIGILLGTPDYMAPEQIPDSEIPVSAATDIYALGVILYELLNGQPPFHSKSLATQFNQLRNEEPPPLRHLKPEIPKDLETICLKCLRKKPNQRYATAQDLAEDLGLFLRGEPIHARPLSVWEKVVAWAHRVPILAAHLVAISLLYLMHLVALFILQEPSHSGRTQLYINLTFLIWLGAVFIIQYIYQHQHQRLGEYLYIILPMCLIYSENILNVGPAYNIPTVLLLVILLAALIRPQISMIWFATFSAQVSFTGYALLSNALDRLHFSTERILIFNLIILLTGIVLSLLLRRVRCVEGGLK